MTERPDARVRAYLDELDRQLRGLPRERRREIVRDIAAHIDAELALAGRSAGVGVSLAKPSGPGADLIGDVLDRLGPPAEIAQAARAESPAVRARIAGRDIAAIVLLLLGGFAFAIGWVVGVVLLWTSPAWRVRDKIVATLLVPGGLVTPLLLSGLALNVSATSYSCVATSAGQTCTSSGGGTSAVVLAMALMVVAVGGPVLSAIWLGLRATKTPVGGPASR